MTDVFNSVEEKIVSILNGIEKKSCGNKKLIQALGITEEEYNVVKGKMIKDGVVKSGRGKGGSLVLIVKESV